MTRLIFQIVCCHYGAVVKEFLACADKPASTPSDAAFSFFLSFSFAGLVYFFSHYFFFWPFFLYSYFRPCWSCTWINIYFKLKSRGLFWKRDTKTLDLHTGQAYDQIKNISCQDMSLLWNRWIFFNVSWHHDTNTQYTTNCTNLQPTPTSKS